MRDVRTEGLDRGLAWASPRGTWFATFCCGLLLGGCGRVGFDPRDGGLADVGDDVFVDALEDASRDGGMDGGTDAPFDASDAADVGECADGMTRDEGPCPSGRLVARCVGGSWGEASCAITRVVTAGGWTDVVAVGALEGGAFSTGLPMEGPRVRLGWVLPEIAPSTSVDGYAVQRREGEAAYSTIAMVDGATTVTEDRTAEGGRTYFYRIAPIVDEAILAPTGEDAEVEVPVPPAGLVLLHRWMANRETCAHLGSAVDRANDYRCTYSGPARAGYSAAGGPPPVDSESYFDMEAHFLVDRVESGCALTLRSAGCPDDAGDPGICLGIGGAAPDATENEKGGNVQVGEMGDVFYDRRSARCYYREPSGWVELADASTVGMQRMTTSEPGHPPLAFLSQEDAAAACEERVVGGQMMTLLSRRVQVALAAWSPALSAAEVNDLERGEGANSCNGDGGHPGEVAFEAGLVPTDEDTIPGTSSSGYRLFRTGSLASSACRSRYGARDLVGNAWEWLSDQCMTGGASATCVGVTSEVASNHDWVNTVLSESIGAGGDDYAFDSASHWLPVLAIPADGTTPSWHDAQPSAGVDFHGDQIFLYVGGTVRRGAYAGGSHTSGSRGGRYALNVSEQPTYTHPRIGFRCMVAVSD